MASNGEDRIDRLERLMERNVEIVEKLATVAQAHQLEIDKLHASTIELRETVTQLVREWQAYLHRLPKQ
jgi:hypothetical protein